MVPPTTGTSQPMRGVYNYHFKHAAWNYNALSVLPSLAILPINLIAPQ